MSSIRERRRKAGVKALVFGTASIGLCTFAFAFEEAISDLCSRGGAYCVLPVLAVCVFTFVHANFASNVWTALGVEASARVGGARQAEAAQHNGEHPSASMRA